MGPGIRAAAAAAAALAVAAAVFALAGAFRAPDSDAATLRGFQIRVLSISQAASENRMDGALAALHALEADLDAAARDGRISAPRLRGIESALDAVRADLTGHLSSQAAVAGPVAEAAAAEAAPTETATQAEAVQPEPAQPVSGGEAVAPLPAPLPDTRGGQLPDTGPENKGKDKAKNKP